MKKISLVVLILSLSLVFITSIGFAADETFVSIATGGTGGTYYPLGGGMADIFNKNVDYVNATAEVTGASVENSRLLENQEVELALVQNNLTYYAKNGIELFEDEALPNQRGIAMLYPEVIQVITLEGKGIDSVKDFEGKRIAVGAPGSGTEADARNIIKAHGLTYDDMEEDFLSFNESVDGLKDGHVDAMFVTGAVPTSAVMDLATQHDVKIVEITDEYVDKLHDEFPFYTKFTIPAESYSGQEEAVDTVTVQAMLVANAKTDEKLIYDLTKALFNNLKSLGEVHPKGKQVKFHTALEGMPIELHEGAKKFYREEYESVFELLDVDY